jgi:hypothetical protein
MSIHSTGLGDDERPSRSVKRRTSSVVTAKYAPLPDWFIISGMRRTATYEALGRGELKAIKLNNRTLVDVEHGLAWLASLPVANITTGRRRRAEMATDPGPETLTDRARSPGPESTSRPRVGDTPAAAG